MRLFYDLGHQSNTTQPRRKLKEEKNVIENFSYLHTYLICSLPQCIRHSQCIGGNREIMVNLNKSISNFFLMVQITDTYISNLQLIVCKVKYSLSSGWQMARRGNSVFWLGKVFFRSNSAIETFIMTEYRKVNHWTKSK